MSFCLGCIKCGTLSQAICAAQNQRNLEFYEDKDGEDKAVKAYYEQNPAGTGRAAKERYLEQLERSPPL